MFLKALGFLHGSFEPGLGLAPVQMRQDCRDITEYALEVGTASSKTRNFLFEFGFPSSTYALFVGPLVHEDCFRNMRGPQT